MRFYGAFLPFSAVVFLTLASHSGEDPFGLRDGDRVVLLGNTFIEREMEECYLETALTRLFEDRDITFRNLGWSGDTVFAEARSYFGPPEEGFQRLIESVDRIDPTVILISYGQNAAFKGEEGLEEFLQGLDRLVKALEKEGRRMIYLSPTFHEDLGAPLPDPADHNKKVALYQEAIAGFASDRGSRYVDIATSPAEDAPRGESIPLTGNGLHYTPYGYWRMAERLTTALGVENEEWEVNLDLEGPRLEVSGTGLEELERTGDGGLSFTLIDRNLPRPPSPPVLAVGKEDLSPSGRVLHIAGLDPGSYALRVDDTSLGIFSADQLAAGIDLAAGPEFDQVEALREKIREKNTLYFHRWRPQNETYLFGFRNHEQGQNAVEIPRFEPLVAAMDKEIQSLKKPRPRRYHIAPTGASE